MEKSSIIEYKDISVTLKEKRAIIDKVVVNKNHEGYDNCKVRNTYSTYSTN